METPTRAALAAALALSLAAAACSERPGAGATPTATVPSTDATPSATASPTPEPSPALEDGRHFGFITKIRPSALEIRFDLAYFLTGDEANEAAAERGDEIPVPNDYYIVNDNPKLRTLRLSPDVRILVLDGFGPETKQGELDDFVEGFEEDSFEGEYHGSAGLYWVVVRDGVVTKIEEQYTP
jgi:hypothetical protein